MRRCSRAVGAFVGALLLCAIKNGSADSQHGLSSMEIMRLNDIDNMARSAQSSYAL